LSPGALNQLLGNIDLYLLDQVLKGRFTPDMRILDVGCGEGRNLVYFIRQGMEVWGIDRNPEALKLLRMYGKSLHPDFDPEKIIEDDATDISLPPASFDGIISSAVLHFAESHAHFGQMFAELTRLLRPGGILFVRMAMLEGIEAEAEALNREGRYLLPDGSERYLLSYTLLSELCERHQLHLLEPLKYVVVHQARSMGSFVLQKQV
jgi:SAM-dependent methyltransferase